jgi:hypothetical protein
MAKKRALCVGINDYPYDGNHLNGCVNDARAWAGLLSEHFAFPATDVTLLTDRAATKRGIVDGLKALLAGAQAGDTLVFTNSSHGSYVVRDERTYQEVLCPYDVEDNHLTTDELRELIGGLKKGVMLTAIIDSCFNGTATRAAVIDMGPYGRSPDDRRVRFMSPALRGLPILENALAARPAGQKSGPKPKPKAVFLNACKVNQYCYDAFIEGAYHGVLTHHALRCIRQSKYRLTYAQLHARTETLMLEANYPQHPQLEASPADKKRLIFG